MKKIKMINDIEDNKSNEIEIIKNKFENQNNKIDNNSNSVIPIIKINKSTFNSVTKKQQQSSFLELYNINNKSNKKNNTKNFIKEDLNLNLNNKENIEKNNKNDENKNVDCLKSSTIN